MKQSNLSAIVLVVALAGSMFAPPSASADTPSKASEAAADGSDSEQKTTTDPPRFLRSDLILAGALTLGAVHHTDHVLRDNHSGWPFRPQVNEFTASLAVYPIYGTAYALDAGPSSYIVIDSVMSVGLAMAHTLIEPPHHQYDPWAHGTNRTGTHSRPLGRLSQSVSLGLSLAVFGHLASSIVDGMQHGFTWTRTSNARDESVSFRAAPTVFSGGSGVSVSGTF